MKWGQRTKLDELMLHKARLAQRQLFHQRTRLFERGHVQEENGTCLCLANPPLVDLACQIQSKRSRHFLRKDLLYLLRRWRLRELSDSQNLCCGNYWEIALRHFFGVGRLVLNVIHVQVLSSQVGRGSLPLNPFLFPSIPDFFSSKSRHTRARRSDMQPFRT